MHSALGHEIVPVQTAFNDNVLTCCEYIVWGFLIANGFYEQYVYFVYMPDFFFCMHSALRKRSGLSSFSTENVCIFFYYNENTFATLKLFIWKSINEYWDTKQFWFKQI